MYTQRLTLCIYIYIYTYIHTHTHIHTYKAWYRSSLLCRYLGVKECNAATPVLAWSIKLFVLSTYILECRGAILGLAPMTPIAVPDPGNSIFSMVVEFCASTGFIDSCTKQQDQALNPKPTNPQKNPKPETPQNHAPSKSANPSPHGCTMIQV